jgi:hypothetical protein
MKNVETLNSVIRTVLALAIVGGISAAGWFGYSTYQENQNMEQTLDQTKEDLDTARTELEIKANELTKKNKELVQKDELIVEKDGQIEDLNVEIVIKDEEIVKLDTAIRLLKVDHRLAIIKVLEQGLDPETKKTFTIVEFQEVNDESKPIDDPKQFRLKGDTVYIDTWVVKFEDRYIEEADILRSTSMCMFKSIYGNMDGPEGGYKLEKEGTRPNAYGRGTALNDFEKKIWNDFWTIANSPERAKDLGIRAIHGDANFIKVMPGKSYRIELRSSGGLTTKPGEDLPSPNRS